MDHHLLAGFEDQHNDLKPASLGVETTSQFTMRPLIFLERLDSL